MNRRAWAVALAALLVVSTLAAPAGAVQPRVDVPSDPENDPIGWENGYWHNESIDVNQTDGVSRSELEAVVSRTMARVEYIRGLEFETTVPVELQARDEFRSQQRNRSVNASLRVFDNVKFEALFLINESADSIEIQNRNAGSSVLGYYSPRRDAIVLISENTTSLELEELTLAHELLHALQDQHFNLSRFDARTRDRVNANDGLIEGDAQLVQYRYGRQCDGGTWNGTCVAPAGGSGGGGDLANIGVYFVKFQPYSDGPTFVQSLYRRGGWNAVNDAYSNPPASSEQVIHPRKYLEDAPTDVGLEDATAGTWRRVRPPDRPDYGEVGEAAIVSMLVYPLYHSGGRTQIIGPRQWLNRTGGGQLSEFDPLNYDSRYSAGWDGDRLHVYRNAENETAYVWRSVWDSPEEAREFVSGYERVLGYWGAGEIAPNTYEIGEGGFADAFYVSVEGDTVTVVNAPSVGALPEVRTDVSIGGTTPARTTVEFRNTPSAADSPETPADPRTPTAADPAASRTGTPGQPGFGLGIALLGIVLVALVRRIRR